MSKGARRLAEFAPYRLDIGKRRQAGFVPEALDLMAGGKPARAAPKAVRQTEEPCFRRPLERKFAALRRESGSG